MSYVKVELSLHGMQHKSLAEVMTLIEQGVRSALNLQGLEGDVEIEPIESAGLDI